MKTFYCSLIFILSVIILAGCSSNKEKPNVADIIKTEQMSADIPIEGMSCSSCAANIKHALSDLNGVTDVIVSLENKKATLQYDSQKISLDSIIKTIDKIGYKVGKPKRYSK